MSTLLFSDLANHSFGNSPSQSLMYFPSNTPMRNICAGESSGEKDGSKSLPGDAVSVYFTLLIVSLAITFRPGLYHESGWRLILRICWFFVCTKGKKLVFFANVDQIWTKMQVSIRAIESYLKLAPKINVCRRIPRACLFFRI